MKTRVCYHTGVECISCGINTWFKRSGTLHIRCALRTETTVKLYGDTHGDWEVGPGGAVAGVIAEGRVRAAAGGCGLLWRVAVSE
eukprot:COSAG02_NODE_295_length_25421_cov_88.063226_6_plen_85_part_00